MPIPQLNVRAISSGAIAALLEQREDGRQFPCASIYGCMAILRQNTWNILENSAAGDMREPVDPAFLTSGSSAGRKCRVGSRSTSASVRPPAQETAVRGPIPVAR